MEPNEFSLFLSANLLLLELGILSLSKPFIFGLSEHALSFTDSIGTLIFLPVLPFRAAENTVDVEVDKSWGGRVPKEGPREVRDVHIGSVSLRCSWRKCRNFITKSKLNAAIIG